MSSAFAVARRQLRRPFVLGTISVVCLGSHHVLLRTVAHDHVAQTLLTAGSRSLDTNAALLAIALVVVRFVSYILVPGLMLAAAAEVVAYLLVGPKRTILEDALPDEDDHER